jgi:phosphoenolpyruvate-protein kinase (PTS system EI component)
MSVSALPESVTTALSKLSKSQQDVLAHAPAEMKPFLEAQFKMSQEQQLGEWITKMMKGDHEQATSVLRNIGG